MKTNLPLPSTLTLRDWADQAVFNLDSYGAFPKLSDDKAWKEWAACFHLNTSLSSKGLPDPYGYDDWKLWAQRFCEVLT
jgi:hypothetical protein